MAPGQSTTHARLMGAISRRRYRPSTRCGPSRASCSGGFFVFRSTARSKISRRKPERETRIPGLAPKGACSKRGACRRERGASRIPMAERTPRGSRQRRAVLSAASNLHFIWFAASRGSTDAGGEDFGYFAPWKERVRIPPVKSRTVEAPRQGYVTRHGFGSSARQEP